MMSPGRTPLAESAAGRCPNRIAARSAHAWSRATEAAVRRRKCSAQSSFYSANDRRLHFGLGTEIVRRPDHSMDQWRDGNNSKRRGRSAGRHSRRRGNHPQTEVQVEPGRTTESRPVRPLQARERRILHTRRLTSVCRRRERSPRKESSMTKLTGQSIIGSQQRSRSVGNFLWHESGNRAATASCLLACDRLGRWIWPSGLASKAFARLWAQLQGARPEEHSFARSRRALNLLPTS